MGHATHLNVHTIHLILALGGFINGACYTPSYLHLISFILKLFRSCYRKRKEKMHFIFLRNLLFGGCLLLSFTYVV